MHTKQVILKDLGLIDYKEAWDLQTVLQKSIIQKKTGINKQSDTGPHYLLICQHPPVFTLGRSGKEDHLLINTELLKAKDIDFYKINRGGDITYHGPGQIVVYPIFDMEAFYTDVHKYVRMLEEIVIKVLAEYKLEGYRNPKYTGVWLSSRIDHQPKKIAAIGVHLSRWVSMHGLAFNISTDLSPFDFIVPCGIRDPEKGVTSLHLETDQAIDIIQIQAKIKDYFAQYFQYEYLS